MALHGGGHLELKKMHKGDFWGLFRIRLGGMSRYHSRKNQLSAILFQVPVFFSLMLLHYLPRMYSKYSTGTYGLFFDPDQREMISHKIWMRFYVRSM